MGTFYAYCRQSTNEQTSLDAQEEHGKQTAESFPDHLYKVVREVYSGAEVKERPLFAAMVANLEKGDVLSVWDSSRLGRNAIEVQTIRQTLRQIGVLLLEGGKPYEDTPTDKLQSQIIDAISEFQRAIQREKSIKGINLRHKKGDWIIRDCYGYDREGKSISVNEGESKQVQEIFNLFQGGKTLNSICGILNLQTQTKRGGRWTPTTVRRVLLRPLYAGYYYQERSGQGKGVYVQARTFALSKLIEATHYPPIISLEQFTTCLNLLLNRQLPHQSAPETRKGKHLLTGLVHCERCYNEGKMRSDTSFRHCHMSVNGKKEPYIVSSPTHGTHDNSRSVLPRWFAESVVKSSIEQFFQLKSPASEIYQYLLGYQKKRQKEAIEAVSDKRSMLKNMNVKLKKLEAELEIGLSNLLRLTGSLADRLQSRLESISTEAEIIKRESKVLELEIAEKSLLADVAAIWRQDILDTFNSQDLGAMRKATTDVISKILVSKEVITIWYRAGVFLTVFLPPQIRKTTKDVECYWSSEDIDQDDFVRSKSFHLSIDAYPA